MLFRMEHHAVRRRWETHLQPPQVGVGGEGVVPPTASFTPGQPGFSLPLRQSRRGGTEKKYENSNQISLRTRPL